MPKQLTMYVLDDAPGSTVEEKAYGVITEGFREVGWHEKASDPDDELVENMVRRRYRILGAVQTSIGAQSLEWAVTIEGDDDDIDEYQEVLTELE